MTDIQLIGSTYSLNDMMRELTDGIFRADVAGNVNTLPPEFAIRICKQFSCCNEIGCLQLPSTIECNGTIKSY